LAATGFSPEHPGLFKALADDHLAAGLNHAGTIEEEALVAAQGKRIKNLPKGLGERKGGWAQ
jgi:hypothetical protein